MQPAADVREVGLAVGSGAEDASCGGGVPVEECYTERWEVEG